MRCRTTRTWAGWAGACWLLLGAGACNALLGNSEHEVAAADAATDATTGGSGSSSGSGSGSSSGGDSGSGSGGGRDGEAGGCTDACTLGHTQCQGSGVQTCVIGSGGCTAWGAGVACASGTCAGGQCTGACSPPGATQCSGNGLQTCTGGSWGSPAACVDQTCVAGTDGGAGCTGVCAPGQMNAVACGNCGTDTESCGPAGTWVSGTCTGQGVCTPNAMQNCNVYGTQTCSASCAWGACSCAAAPVCTPNAKQCSGSNVQTCSECGQWGSAVACGSGQTCSDGGVCVTPPPPPSCAPGGAGMTNCGSGSTSCCASLEVAGGTYDRSYDGFMYTSTSSPATVSGFRLDQYEITVGRLRQYVSYLSGGGSLPGAGSGKHTHLNGGQGLAATGGGYETGWDATWNSQIATTASGWNSNLGGGTWTASAGSNENLPITEIDWYEAYAFCIWDGGFLPSEAEWNYAAAGGSDQRAYPWSPAYPPGSTSISCTDANYSGCPAGAANAVGSESPAGDGKWGQSDLAGNAWEWNLDWYASSYNTPCTDCANLTAASSRVDRGGGFGDATTALLASYRGNIAPTDRYVNVGARCARTP